VSWQLIGFRIFDGGVMQTANFGMMGLGVMGHMLALNVERNGFRVAGYDLDAAKVQAFGAQHPRKPGRLRHVG
jgi:6-phosphogluconate dehydrogenase